MSSSSSLSAPPSRLNARSRRILYTLITEYIATGEPVGSRRLTTRYGIELSAATVRNVLADLEDMGLVRQPHSSSGRVPTEYGFRVFVDALVKTNDLDDVDRSAIFSRMQSLSPDEQSMREAGKLLSSLAGTVAVVSLPKLEREKLKQLRFVPLREGEMLAVLVAESGHAESRVIKLAQALSPSELDRLHNYLNELIAGHTLAQVRSTLAEQIERERGNYQQLKQYSLDLLEAVIAEGPREGGSLVIEGQDKLFEHPEFADAEKIKQFLRTFEDKAQLVDLLDRTMMAKGLNIAIGAEANLAGVDDVSVISAAYDPSGGAVAVIGLTRIDYAKVIPIVSFTAQALGEAVANKRRGNDND